MQLAPDVRATCVQTINELDVAVAAIRGPTRLIAFCTDLVVPGPLIGRLNGDCFNFHSGPPERPGYRPGAFALRERDDTFGVTFHRMIAQVDAGPIYAVRRFGIDYPCDEETLGARIYRALLALVDDLAPALAAPDTSFTASGERWTGRRTTRADYQRLRTGSSA